MRRRKAVFTLTELLVSVSIVSFLSLLATAVYGSVFSTSAVAECASRLRQSGLALSHYANDHYNRFPSAVPPLGFGNLYQWGELWKNSDLNGNGFFSEQNMSGGVKLGNRTLVPRIPRLELAQYCEDVTAFHCNEQGFTQDWPDVGPYYYYTTAPWGKTLLPSGGTAVNYGKWEPMLNRAKPNFYALLSCQNPDPNSNSTWRHGPKERQRKPEQLNNFWFADGSVKTYQNPRDWTAQNKGK